MRVLLDMCQHDHAKSWMPNLWRMKATWDVSIWPSQEQESCHLEKNSRSVSIWPNQEPSYGGKSKDHATWRKVLDLCQYDQIKNHHIKQKATWLMSIWPRQEQELGSMEKNSWSLSMWPNQESSYGGKSKDHATWRIVLDLCQYDQIKNHHIKQKATWLMSIWPSQEQKLGNMGMNSWTVSIWPDHEPWYEKTLLGSCHCDQTKSGDWENMG